MQDLGLDRHHLEASNKEVKRRENYHCHWLVNSSKNVGSRRYHKNSPQNNSYYHLVHQSA